MSTSTNYTIVDELGRLLARKAELEKEEARLKGELHGMGPGAYEGKLFRATVGADGSQWRRDAKAMRDKLWALGYYAFVKAHEEEVPRTGSVRVVAKTGQDVKEAA
jgi:hypothetical protein